MSGKKVNTSREASGAEDEKALLDRIDKIESSLLLHDELRKTQARWTWVGAGVILAVLLVFVFRLCSHFNGYAAMLDDPAKRQIFLKDMLAQTAADKMIKEQADILARQLMEDVLPTLKDDLMSELQSSFPKIEEAGIDLGDRLYSHCQKHIEERLDRALRKSMENLGAELSNIFPEFSPEDITGQLDASKELFIEKLTVAIEERIARVDASVTGLKGAVKQLGEKGDVSAVNVEQAQGEFIDAIVELLVYELKPELGADIADK